MNKIFLLMAIAFVTFAIPLVNAEGPVVQGNSPYTPCEAGCNDVSQDETPSTTPDQDQTSPYSPEEEPQGLVPSSDNDQTTPYSPNEEPQGLVPTSNDDQTSQGAPLAQPQPDNNRQGRLRHPPAPRPTVIPINASNDSTPQAELLSNPSDETEEIKQSTPARITGAVIGALGKTGTGVVIAFIALIAIAAVFLKTRKVKAKK